MSELRKSDAIVVGGGVSGLVAAAYLARAGKKVLLLEARDKFGGLCESAPLGEGFSAPLAHLLYALDPRVVKELKLARRGLAFAARDMALVGLRSDGKHIVIQRDVHATAANIAVHSQRDASAWPRFRRELFDLALALRPLWWERNGEQPRDNVCRRLEHLSRVGAAAWLDSWFETDALKATLCFDATEGGLSTLEPGSALALVWRAAQEMSGLQGAVAQAQGSSLVNALVAAARAAGAELRTGARVVEVLSDGTSIAGIRLETGEIVSAPQVLCSLSRRRTLSDLVLPPAAGIAQGEILARSMAPTAQAKVVLAVRGFPAFGGIAVPRAARFILADRLETYASAEMAARSGGLASELPMEIVLPSVNDATLAPAGQHIVSLLLRPVPRQPAEGWAKLKPVLAARAIQAFERLGSDLSGRIAAADVLTSDDFEKRCYEDPHTNVDRMLAKPESRIATPLSGLLLCGADAEPVPAVSGRAARIAASMITGRK
ncbi:MAG TPA: NAD(P)/FAD-dependent oxidoreductase [Rhizomicrobium sp.]